MADIFLLPTEYEIFGMVLLEAMYYKTIVLTTDNGGANTLITDKKNGFIMKELNSCLWAERIEKLAKDTGRIQNIKDDAHSTIKEGFTWDVLAGAFIDSYKKIK